METPDRTGALDNYEPLCGGGEHWAVVSAALPRVTANVYAPGG